MLNRLRRRYLEKNCSRDMDAFIALVDEKACEIAHENDLNEFEAREFVLYSLLRNPSYRIAACHVMEGYQIA